jgi:ADP-ribosylation factor-like protein 4
VWDVGGQEKLRPLWRSYTRCTDGIIFVVDSCKEDRLEEAKLELLKIWKTACHIPVLVLANKQDLPSALDVSKIESQLGLKELGSTYHWHIQPTCAITGEGLDEGVEKLHELILNRRKMTRNGVSKNGLVKPSAAASKSSRKVQRSHSHHY